MCELILGPAAKWNLAIKNICSLLCYTYSCRILEKANPLLSWKFRNVSIEGQAYSTFWNLQWRLTCNENFLNFTIQKKSILNIGLNIYTKKVFTFSRFLQKYCYIHIPMLNVNMFLDWILYRTIYNFLNGNKLIVKCLSLFALLAKQCPLSLTVD